MFLVGVDHYANVHLQGLLTLPLRSPGQEGLVTVAIDVERDYCIVTPVFRGRSAVAVGRNVWRMVVI